MIARDYNSSTWEAEARDHSEYEASLNYGISSRRG